MSALASIHRTVMRLTVQTGLKSQSIPHLAKRHLMDYAAFFSTAGFAVDASSDSLGSRPALHLPREGAGNGTLLYFHGGGYAYGGPAGHRRLVRELSRHAGMDAWSLDYRKAPENPYPAAVDDAEAAYKDLLNRGIPAPQITIGGDSAGGGLAMALLVRLQKSSTPLPAAVALISPWVDLTGDSHSLQRMEHQECMLHPASIKNLALLYRGATDARNPEVSPLFADHKGFPPVIIHTGALEVLLDDTTRLADKLTKAGVKNEVRIFPDMFHDFQLFSLTLPEAAESLRQLGEFLKQQIA